MSRRANLSVALAGALSGVAGALVFAALHAVIIVPIWDRMTGGLIFGAIAGVGAGFACAEFYPSLVSHFSVGNVLRGMLFGSLLWIVVVPVSAADAILRATGIAPRFELVAVGVALALSISAGGLLGWRVTHRRRGVIIGAVATLFLMMAMAGPVPIGRGGRALGIFFAVLPASAVGGAVLAVLGPYLYRRLQEPHLT